MATEFLGVCKRCVLVLHYNNPASVFLLLLLTIVRLHRAGIAVVPFFFLPSAAVALVVPSQCHPVIKSILCIVPVVA